MADPMTDSALASLLAAQERQAVGYYTSEIATEQAESLKYYYGQPFGDEMAGRSSVVDRTVAVVIDNAVAAMLKPFVSTDDAVTFSPRTPDDEKIAQQATEYVNYIFHCDNDGFILLHDWAKAGLLEKVGVVKAYWQPRTETKRTPAVVDAMQLQGLAVVEGPYERPDGLFEVVTEQEVEDGSVVIETVPSEEFRISPYARSMDDAFYVGHITRKSRSDLIGMGFDADVVESLSTFAETDDDPRSDVRYGDEDIAGERAGLQTDHAGEEVQFAHEWVRVDFDGDGVAELREIMRVGHVILYNEETKESGFAAWCPVPMPHKFWGLSLADQTRDLQRVQSVLWRQALDNTYLSNNPRPILPETAERRDGSTMDDIETPAPGAFIRTAGNTTSLDTLTVPFTGDKSLALIQYAERQQESRTGVTRIGQGLGADVLKDQEQTTGGLQLVEQAQNTRIELIARIFAETGLKPLFRKILSLVHKHQPRERVIRLRNEWVPVDPSGWSVDMDVNINVGLGVGSRTEQAAAAMNVLQVLNEVLQSPYGYLVKPEGAYNALKKLLNANGYRNTDAFLIEPGPDNPPPPQGPDPKAQEVQAKLALEQQRMQMDMQRSQAEMQLRMAEAEQTRELKAQEAAAKLELERERAAAEVQLAREKAESEYRLAVEKMALEAQLAERRLSMEREIAGENAAIKAESIRSNRPGGSLAE